MGTIFTDKGLLLTKIGERVGPNSEFATSSQDIQDNDCDIIESLWARGCESTEFTTTVDGATISLTRTVCGSSVTMLGKIVNSSIADTAKRCDLLEVIPQDFNGHSWFKIQSLTMVHNEDVVTNENGVHGYIELDEISSYESGVAVTDKTILHIAGKKKGVGRSYNIDTYNQFIGPINGIVDRVENETAGVGATENYLLNSPLDIRTKPLNLSYLTLEQALLEGHPTISASSSLGLDISFVIKGELL